MEKLREELDFCEEELELCEDQVKNLARQLAESREKIRIFRKNDKIKNTEIDHLKEQIGRLSTDYSNFLNRFGFKLGNIIRKKSLKESKKNLRYTPLSPGKAKELSEKFKSAHKAKILKKFKETHAVSPEPEGSSSDSNVDEIFASIAKSRPDLLRRQKMEKAQRKAEKTPISDKFIASIAKSRPDLYQRKTKKAEAKGGGQHARRRKRRTRRRKRRTRRRRGGAPRKRRTRRR